MLDRLNCVFMRGGTSKALMLRREDLPQDRAAWDPIFLAAMGSPDPNGRQLDGMGGGLSSLSKVCIIGPSSRPDADLDYTFAQISVRDASVDYSGNCGNMSSAVGPFAVEEGIVAGPRDGEAVVRIHNTNTAKIIVSRFQMRDGAAIVSGDLAIDGIAGAGAPIRLDFTDPAGAKTGRLLPTGRAVDILEAEGGSIAASCIDAANPCVFVAAADLGLTGAEMPDALDSNHAVLNRLEAIRRAASVAMGLAPDLAAAAAIRGVPKVAMISGPAAFTSLSGRQVAAEEADLTVRMISIGQPHRALPLTGALCLATACRVSGTLANRLMRQDGDPAADIRIAQASGITRVAAQATRDGNPAIDEGWRVPHATVYRTARRLFEGRVLYRRG